MKTPYKNIYTVLGTNRQIVIAALSVALLSIVFSLVFVFLMYKRTVNSSYAINLDGSVLPMKLIETKESFDIEVMNNLDIFHRYFYDLNANNYETQLEKALWLGNESVDAVYRQKKAEGVYNKLVQFNLIQRVTDISTQIDTRTQPFQFVTVVNFEVSRGTTIDLYQVITKGNLVKIDRNYPHNPHGLLITNFYEDQLKRINNEDR